MNNIGGPVTDSPDSLRAERDALRAVLREIVNAYNQTYEAELHSNGRWTDAASIPVEVMERAGNLLWPEQIFDGCTCDGVTECDRCKKMREVK